MNKKFRQIITQHISENRTGYLFSAVYIVIGIVLGSVSGTNAAEIDPECISAFSSAFSLHGASSKDILAQSFYSNLRLFILLWISGWFLWLYPINILELISKGYGIGYTTSYLISSMGTKGFFLASVSLFTLNLLIVPLLIMYSATQLRFSLSFSKIRSSASAYRQRKLHIKRNIITLIIVMIFIFLCSMLEAYVIPKFITIICCNFA